jgi:uncharacterized protein
MFQHSGTLHEVVGNGRRLLFHTPTAALFEADAVTGAVLDLLREGAAPASLARQLDGRFPLSEIATALDELQRLDRPAVTAPAATAPLTTLVLALTSGCNLACDYCYKHDLSNPAAARRMTPGRAAQAVDLLLRASGKAPKVTVTFFGGEPLLEMPVIRATIAYAEAATAAAGKKVDFSLTTNGTLLDDATIDFLDVHRVGITISLDGPAALHDRHRRTRGGQGSHALAAAGARRLLARPRARRAGARVTLAAGCTDVATIHAYLHEELGFDEIGFAPVTAGTPAEFRLSDDELAIVFDGFKALGLRWRDAAIEGRDLGFGNLANLVTALNRGMTRALPCGAGTQMLAADAEGTLHLCHRFVGDSEVPSFGTLDDGIDAEAVTAFVARAQARAEGCAGCIARPVCAGGCYHESQSRHGDLFRPTDHYCTLMRDWIRFGIGVTADIMARNPAFFAANNQPRRAAR